MLRLQDVLELFTHAKSYWPNRTQFGQNGGCVNYESVHFKLAILII